MTKMTKTDKRLLSIYVPDRVSKYLKTNGISATVTRLVDEAIQATLQKELADGGAKQAALEAQLAADFKIQQAK